MADHVFPEDQGTNSELEEPGEGDENEASSWAGAHYSPNDVDYVLDGLDLTADWAAGELDISEGKAKIHASEAEGSQTGEVRRDVAFTVEPDPRSGLSLDSGTNHVYLNVLLTDDDALKVDVNSTGNAPNEPSLKIGIVDTAAETVDELNRAPEGRFEGLVLEDTATEN